MPSCVIEKDMGVRVCLFLFPFFQCYSRPLIVASGPLGSIGMVDLLLEHGASLEETDRVGYTVISYGCLKNVLL